MPVLRNARHEKFAQAVVKGASATAAYREHISNTKAAAAAASRLLKTVKVAARIKELQGAAAKRAVVTAQDIASQLDEDRAFARGQNSPSAMVAATMGKAKVLGLIIEKRQHSFKKIEDMTEDELAALVDDGGD